MDTAPTVQKKYNVQLPRHNEPRKALVVSVDEKTNTATVEYPNTTSRIALMGDIREEIDWKYISSL